MKAVRLFIYLVIFAMTSQACSTAGSRIGAAKILFADNFSDQSKRWDQVSSSSGSADYYNQNYRITVKLANLHVWAKPGNESFIDSRIEVNATKIGGPDDNDFGILCRYIDSQRFYYGVISSDGYYAIMKMTSNGAQPIGKDSMLEDDSILQGGVTNHLRFNCVGPNLTLYVNGTQIDQQTDAEYTTGNVGLLAGSFATAGTDIVFDNFFVYKP